ncbi:hypothetical protein B0I27_10649 [Arcticibacter pallidicorallinus]|uniref:Uncharacterized protein n=1 Tax=Arcticibacter pallidicorallinus TaxID=1259464 RepID=A0A2T0U2Z7_9SPHI|nr:hypothetical protein [Arcticibacter pallidicorallinus]PRY52290.1 hypothetical protein B0I27_10649 [Arcticibacter pallidicorallinus]
MSLYRQVFTTFILLYATSCTGDKKAPDNQNTFFDIGGFFTTEAERLNRKDQGVLKQVDHNGKIEEQEVKITDWKKELDLFISSDINKPSWKNSYAVKKEKNVTSYTALDTSLKVRKISIERSGRKISAIEINSRVNNEIYTSSETLKYYPDSLYSIKKEQDVRGLGNNTYKINGKIKP